MPAPRPRTTPRKRPRQARAHDTVEAILAATARVLVKDGFDHASTNRIAEAAGVSIGSLYQYFPSKEALVAALVERHTDEMSALMGDALGRIAPLGLRDATRQVVTLTLRAHEIDPRLHRVLVEQVPRVGRLDRIHAVERQMIALVRGYLEARRAELRPRDLDTAAWMVVTTVEALTHMAVMENATHLDRSRLADEITELVVRYLEK